MLKAHTLAALTVFVLLLPFTCLAQDIDLLWKARALQAAERLEVLEKQQKTNKSMKLRFEIMLESAYAYILLMPDVTVKRTPKITAYHFIMSYVGSTF
jgi:hypothetical protein